MQSPFLKESCVVCIYLINSPLMKELVVTNDAALRISKNSPLFFLPSPRPFYVYINMPTSAVSWLYGSTKTGHKANFSTLQNVYGKLVQLKNVHGKLVRKFSYRILFQNNFQRRYFVATADSGPISLPWIGWQSQTDITSDHPISIMCKFDVYGNILAPIVHADLC